MKMKINVERDLKEILIKKLELDTYLKIVKYVQRDGEITGDSDEAKNFRKKYNAYFRVRRNEEWQLKYYEFMQEHRTDENLQFEDVIKYLNENCKTKNGNGCVEPSFASKLLAVINTSCPIWDSIVLENLNLKRYGNNGVDKAIDGYKKLSDIYNEFINSEKGKEEIEKFKKYFRDCYSKIDEISDTKIVDCLIWGKG